MKLSSLDVRASETTVYAVDDEKIPVLSDLTKLKEMRKTLAGGSNRRLSCAGAPSLDNVLEEDEEDDGDALKVYGKYRRMNLEERSIIKGRTSERGRDIFGFRTPVKKNQMVEKVNSELKSRRLSSAACSPCSTPTKTRKGASSRENTPKRTPSSKVASTPYSFRKRVSKQINKIQFDIDQEDDEESSESSSSSSDEDEVDQNIDESKETAPTIIRTPDKKMNSRIPSTPKTPSTRRRNLRGSKTVNSRETADSYFQAHGDDAVTSDRTLSRLKTPRLSQEAMQTILSSVRSAYQKEIQDLCLFHENRFDTWDLLLEEGFNIVTFGLGSKRRILQRFQERKITPQEDCVVVNGFFPSLTIKQILNSITDDILTPSSSNFTGIPDHCQFILNSVKEPLFLIIHNIDGANLRGEKAQSVLAQLASHPMIHLVCSIDHINAPLIWDQKKLSKFNFIWYDVTTFLPYTQETLNENSLMIQQSNSLALSSLAAVFASLTPNAKGIYILIAENQIECSEDDANYSGISFPGLYQRCREAFLVNSDITLRAQLTEFKDHKLIRIKKGFDGTDHLMIPLNNLIMKDFIDEQKETIR